MLGRPDPHTATHSYRPVFRDRVVVLALRPVWTPLESVKFAEIDMFRVVRVLARESVMVDQGEIRVLAGRRLLLDVRSSRGSAGFIRGRPGVTNHVDIASHMVDWLHFYLDDRV